MYSGRAKMAGNQTHIDAVTVFDPEPAGILTAELNRALSTGPTPATLPTDATVAVD